MKYSTFSLEKAMLDNGYSLIGGMDEAGRGCLAGPVVAAVVVISSEQQYLPGVWDSKIMSKKRREDIFEELCECVDSYGIGEAGVDEIDNIGIGSAAALAMRRAYGQLGEKPDVVLIDGARVKAPNLRRLRIKEGDRKHYVISAASVLAKVARDRKMAEFARKYPEFGFDHNAGYGTKEHITNISKFGVTALHRKSYSPVKRYLLGGGTMYE